jgi:hypothetical protein
MFSISASMNTEKQEKLALTATCSNTKSSDSEIETWNLHCDLNGNGVIDKDEATKTVSVNTKANEFYCKGMCVISASSELDFSKENYLGRVEMHKASWRNVLMRRLLGPLRLRGRF